MALVVNFAIGVLFAIGLAVGGMTDPAKVLNFLDFAGRWDPSLAFVMGGAVVVTFAGYRFAWRRGAPFRAAAFERPAKRRIDTPVLVGPAIFGIGWGLGGYCPGPALSALAIGHAGTLVFVPALFAGMALARRFARRRRSPVVPVAGR